MIQASLVPQGNQKLQCEKTMLSEKKRGRNNAKYEIANFYDRLQIPYKNETWEKVRSLIIKKKPNL